MDIERLFNQKQRFSTPIVFSVASITEGILKLVFKTMVECVRLTTFGKHGFQQVQVGCRALRGLGIYDCFDCPPRAHVWKSSVSLPPPSSIA
jgi:hypothetical protein